MSDLASFESNRRHLGRVLCLVAVTIVCSGTAAESAGVPPAFRAPRIVRVFAPPPAPPALIVQPAPQPKPQAAFSRMIDVSVKNEGVNSRGVLHSVVCIGVGGSLFAFAVLAVN